MSIDQHGGMSLRHQARADLGLILFPLRPGVSYW